MFTKIRFKLELYSYYLKKNLPYIFLGLTVGVTAYFLQEPLKDLYQKLNRPMLKIGIEGLFSTTNLPSDITQKYLLDLLSSVRTTELHSPPWSTN